MKTFQKMIGLSALSQGLIYIVAFVYFGAFWAYPGEAGAAEKMAYLAAHQLSYSVIHLLMYVVFGALLALLVVGLHQRLKEVAEPWVSVGSLFGVVWVGLVIASGMIATIGLTHAIALMASSPEQAYELYRILSVITDSIGGGNELVGGLWVLLISVAALKAKVFARWVNYLGCFVGVAGIATVYPADVFTEIFGLSQIVWFFALGGSLLLQKDVQDN